MFICTVINKDIIIIIHNTYEYIFLGNLIMKKERRKKFFIFYKSKYIKKTIIKNINLLIEIKKKLKKKKN